MAGEGDIVIARARKDLDPGTVVIEEITGDEGRLSKDPKDNCVGIAALDVLSRIPDGVTCGVGLTLRKQMPLGSGLGSSAASAAAAAEAVNSLFGHHLPRHDLVLAGLASEATVSGYHADNIAPAVMGGFVLVRGMDPEVDLVPLKWPGGALYLVLVNPKFEAPTRKMRAAMPDDVPRASWITNAAAGGALVAGILTGDAEMLGKALDSDVIVEAARGPLIPGFFAVKAAAKAAGAYGCTISGAGPTCVAVVPDEATGEAVAGAMGEAFVANGLEVNISLVTKLDTRGAYSSGDPEAPKGVM